METRPHDRCQPRRTLPSHGQRVRTLLLGLWIVALGALLMWRFSIGVDLTDEPYYAAFLHWWNGDFEGSPPGLTIHQTSQSLVWPAAKLYSVVAGEEGLLLFLRILYLAYSVLVAMAVYAAVRTFRAFWVSVVIASIVVAFVPFSLPAPSYNTLAMQSLVLSLSLLIVATSAGERGSRKGAVLLLLGSGASTGAAAIANPPWVIAGLALVVALVVGRRWRDALWVSAGAALLALLWLIFVRYALSMDLVSIVKFTAALGTSQTSLIDFAVARLAYFTQTPSFTLLIVLVAGAGGVVRWAGATRPLVQLSGIAVSAVALLATIPLGTFLYLQSHDVILLIAAFGFFPAGFASTATVGSSSSLVKSLRVMYWVGFVAGLTAMWIATQGWLNFPVGAFPSAIAALIAAAPAAVGAGPRWMTFPYLPLLTLLLVLQPTLSYVYGDPGREEFSQRVRTGPYAGLLTGDGRVTFLGELKQSISTACPPSGSHLFLGLPVAYLLSDQPPAALSPWSLKPSTEAGEEIFSEYYADPAHRPSCIAVLAGSPMSRAESALVESYDVRSTIPYPGGGEVQFLTPSS